MQVLIQQHEVVADAVAEVVLDAVAVGGAEAITVITLTLTTQNELSDQENGQKH